MERSCSTRLYVWIRGDTVLGYRHCKIRKKVQNVVGRGDCECLGHTAEEAIGGDVGWSMF